MGRKRTEENFERRIQKILESKGYLVINCARSKPFDLTAIKNMLPILIELKGRNTRYPREQFLKQCKLCKETGNEFLLIEQSKKRGKIRVSEGYSQGYLDTKIVTTMRNDLKEFLE